MEKYRLGKKQKRAILEVATGHEYLVFPQSKTEHVAEFLEWLNAQENGRKAAVTSSNWFERWPLHWKLMYYFIGGIIVGALASYCW